MKLFIRFTEDIQKDIEIGTSILTNENNAVAEGLCAFGPFENEAEAMRCVAFWQKYYPAEHEHYALIEATEIKFCKKAKKYYNHPWYFLKKRGKIKHWR